MTRGREMVGETGSAETDFSVVSYNILADCHMKPDWYGYTPPDCRNSKDRHPRLFAELEELDADILCLQEVGRNYHPQLRDSLEAAGYEGQFLQKELGTEEGEATYWKKQDFQLLEARHLTFVQLLESALKRNGLDPDLALSQCPRDHVLLVTRLKHRSTGKHLTVANIHTVWDNFAQLDVSSLHVALALRELGKEEEAVIFAGDFNSLPTMEPYLIASQDGLSEAELKDLEDKGSAGLGEAVGPIVGCLSNEYQQPGGPALGSAYLTVKGSEPLLTNYDDYDGNHPADWCLDYIWFSTNTLKPVAVLDTVGVPTGRLPDSTFPSDHLSIKASFTFTS